MRAKWDVEQTPSPHLQQTTWGPIPKEHSSPQNDQAWHRRPLMEIAPEWRANKHVQLSMWVGHRETGNIPYFGRSGTDLRCGETMAQAYKQS